jgi:hypothetical protein
VSSGYRQLEREQWVELRRGSGVFVRESKPEGSLSSALLALDQLIANLFPSARKAGAPLSSVRARLRRWLDLQPPDHFLLIESAQELRRIVAVEMQKAVTLAVRTLSSGGAALLLGGGGGIIGGFAGRDFPIFHSKVIYKR